MIEIDPFSIAVQGIQANATPINMVLQGWYIEISEEVIIPESPRESYSIGGGIGVGSNRFYRDQEPKKVKIITVTCEKDGVVIKKSKKYKDITVSIDDIEVEIIETKKKPRINIKLSK